jgi:DNA-binding NarL/FixJ family response regulator
LELLEASGAVNERVHAHIADPGKGGSGQPTARQIEILQLIAEGFSNGEIARRLFITEETCKSHVRAMLTRLPARSRAEAVAIGFRRGLLS